LSLPIEMAVVRNKTRMRKDKACDDYIRDRHSSRIIDQAGSRATAELDTSTNLADTLKRVRTIIWGAI
jgi:hypothetical protein